MKWIYNEYVNNFNLASILDAVSVSPPVPTLGNDVSISCNVTPWPRGAILLWRLNGNPLVSQNGMKRAPRPGGDITGYVMKGKVTERISGEWTCAVLYQGQTKMLVTVPLSVKGEILDSRWLWLL